MLGDLITYYNSIICLKIKTKLVTIFFNISPSGKINAVLKIS